MKSQERHFDQAKKKLEEESDHIEQLRSVLAGEKKCNELCLRYSSHPYAERLLWYNLALLAEVGPIGILAGEKPYTFFDQKDKRLHERIEKLIRKLPNNTLEDFREFVLMTARLLERFKYVCTMTIVQFLEREKGEVRETMDIRVYSEYFTSKLFWETEIIYELRDKKYMKEFCGKYESWLCDKLLSEEVVG